VGPSPSKIGKYGVVGVLAHGTSEDVYIGEHAGRRVAIRLFSGVAGPERDRLVEEARKIAGLSHANIASQEVGVHEDQPFLVAEMSGTNLETWLGGNPSLTEQLGVIEGVCAGVTYAHGHGVVHRGLTSGSVLVTPDGEARIWNFAFSTLKPEKSSLAYVAPEILEGQAATPQSDIYSTGLVCYEILAGIAPKPGDQGVARPIREVRGETPRDLSDAVMACRERAPDWRPKDLSYLLEVVRKLRGPVAPKAPRPAPAPVRMTVPASTARATASGGPPIAAIAIAGALLLGAAAFYFTRGGTGASVAQNPVTTSAPATTLAAAPNTTLETAPTTTPAGPTRPAAAPTTLAAARETPPPTPAPTPVLTTLAAAKASAPPATTAPTTTLPPTTTLAPAPTTTQAPAPTTTQAPAPSAAERASHGVPVLRALSPPMLRRGQTMLVDVRGSDFYAQLVPTLLTAKGGVASDLRVARQRFVNDTLIQVFIEVPASAAPGQYGIVLSDGSASTNTLRLDVAK
jgi:serine/threonine-protein kinase